MKHNIAEFIGTIADGGAETLVKDYALMLDKDKFNVIVIVLRRSPNTANDAILSKSNVRIVPIYKKKTFIFRVIQKLNRWWYVPCKLAEILNRENIEVLHIHLDILKYVSVIRHRIKNIRLFYTCHSEPQYFLAEAVVKENNAAKKLIKDNNLRMIVLHDDMRKEINEIFDIENTAVIHNGIYFQRFRNVTETKGEIRKALSIPENVFIIGHVGRFTYAKNHEFLIDIFNEVCKKNSRAFLLLVGTGELTEVVKDKVADLGISDRVLILSHRSDIPELLKAMDVFAFPSRY